MGRIVLGRRYRRNYHLRSEIGIPLTIMYALWSVPSQVPRGRCLGLQDVDGPPTIGRSILCLLWHIQTEWILRIPRSRDWS